MPRTWRLHALKIKQLEGEIATLKNIVRHYLEEIKRLGEENEDQQAGDSAGSTEKRTTIFSIYRGYQEQR